MSVGSNVNAHPTSADVRRAIDATPKDPDWFISLQSGDDYIEAEIEAEGRYRVKFSEQERSFTASGPVGADTLKAIFLDYLSGNPGWRRRFRSVPDNPRVTGSKLRRRIGSEPPVWVIIAVAGAFFGLQLLSFLPESWVDSLPDGALILWLIAGPMVVMLLAMLINKMIVVRRASTWPQAMGRITRSEVGATYRSSSDGPAKATNYPAIEYEFSVGGQSFIGRRISIGEDTGGANTEATLAHYPVGATVTVSYAPDDPANCVLERDMPKEVPLGCAAMLAALAALIGGGYWLYDHFGDATSAFLKDGQSRTILFSAVGGLIALMLFLGSRWGAKARNTWSSVRGKVVLSRIERHRAEGNRRSAASYVPVVEYAYIVNGHEYRSRQIRLGVDSPGQSSDAATQAAARYPEGCEIEVFYDPSNPGSAALEMPRRPAWYLLVIAGLCFGVAAYAGVWGS
ncbi:MAG: DUF3592 domain-containing protein [Reyranellaceae bacterium]